MLSEEGKAFIKRRDERNDIILERLVMPDTCALDSDQYGIRYIFEDKGKTYIYYPNSTGEFQSNEFRPKMREMREILGVPMIISGIDYSGLFWRVSWSHWGGALTKEQIQRVDDVISAADNGLN
jgi:hypothetical protein